MDTDRRAAARARLASWGYVVTVQGGFVCAAGHGAIHRWRGWDAIAWPADPAWTAGFDGAADPNPGPAACGAWLRTPLGDLAWTTAEPLGMATNHVAEWTGLLRALAAVRAFQATPCRVQGDNQRVVAQYAGAAAARAPRVAGFVRQARALAAGLAVTVVWVPRAANGAADTLAHQALAAPRFPADRLTPAGPGRFVAHGRADYTVDVRRGVCTCPAFRYGPRPCKHLATARAVAP
jgi:ribonuclease HI